MNDLQQIQTERTILKEHVVKSEKLEKLMANPDFKEIFLDGYLTDESLRLVGVIGMVAPSQQAGIVNEMIGVSNFRDYINRLAKQGEEAAQRIPEFDVEIDTIEDDSQGED